jgi:hypothetical protein
MQPRWQRWRLVLPCPQRRWPRGMVGEGSAVMSAGLAAASVGLVAASAALVANEPPNRPMPPTLYMARDRASVVESVDLAVASL